MNLAFVPSVRTKTHEEAAFSHYGPRLWSGLPEGIGMAETVDVFKRRFKTHLFMLAFYSFVIYIYFFTCLVVSFKVHCPWAFRLFDISSY